MTRISEGKFRELLCHSENICLYCTRHQVVLRSLFVFTMLQVTRIIMKVISLKKCQLRSSVRKRENPIDPVILCGDFNARTSVDPDYDQPDSYLCDCEPKVTVPVPRPSQDSVLNARGKRSRYIGRLYTCEKYDGGSSLVDYLLVQENDMNTILILK